MYSLSRRLESGLGRFVLIGLTFLQVTDRHAMQLQMGPSHDKLTPAQLTDMKFLIG